MLVKLSEHQQYFVTFFSVLVFAINVHGNTLWASIKHVGVFRTLSVSRSFMCMQFAHVAGNAGESLFGSDS